MQDYSALKHSLGRPVSQTVDSPILIFDFFELQDAFLTLFIILVFGVVLYAWEAMLVGLLIVIVGIPIVRRRNEKGVFLHKPYKALGMKLPGLFNPGKKKKYSD